MLNQLENTSITQSEKPILLQPENQNKRYDVLFSEIDQGRIKLPMFQREFVWEKEQSAKLIDSILKGFPIGTFIFWKTKDVLRSYREVGNHKLPETPSGDYVEYILDGQQRITSLYAIRKGIRITKDGKELDYKDIHIDLDFNEGIDEQIVVTEKKNEKQYVSVFDVLNKSLVTIMTEMGSEKAGLIEKYKSKLTSYDFSTITIKDYPIDIACEIFSRINTGGKALTVFEIMVAKTYDETKKFDLAERYEILRDGDDEQKECLQLAKFETLPESLIMQCVSAIVLKAVRGKDILKIGREDFIEHWEPMKKSLFTAIDFIRTELRIPVSQLLPYPALLVPLTYFFHKLKNKKPAINQIKKLEQFFYWVGLTERYSSSSDSKVGEDLNKMKTILLENFPDYATLDLVISKEKIEATQFAPNNAFCKSVICLFAYQEPKSFDTNGVVILDNSNLKISSSRNYHHFFPKAYVKKHHLGKEPNLIANITLIDGYSNKHVIGSKKPSEYIKNIQTTNPSLIQTLKTHLIDDLRTFGVFNDNYDFFVSQRSNMITDALNKKLSLQ